MSPRFHVNHAAKKGANEAPIPASLDDAISVVVHDSPIPPKAIADAVGIGYAYLLAASDANREDTKFQARLIAPITTVTGNDAIVRYLAHAVGGVFVRVPAGMLADEHTARSLKEFGDYLHSVAAASGDGIITREEAASARRQATEAMEAILAHVTSLEARAVDLTPVAGLRRA